MNKKQLESAHGRLVMVVKMGPRDRIEGAQSSLIDKRDVHKVGDIGVVRTTNFAGKPDMVTIHHAEDGIQNHVIYHRDELALLPKNPVARRIAIIGLRAWHWDPMSMFKKS